MTVKELFLTKIGLKKMWTGFGLFIMVVNQITIESESLENWPIVLNLGIFSFIVVEALVESYHTFHCFSSKHNSFCSLEWIDPDLGGACLYSMATVR